MPMERTAITMPAGMMEGIKSRGDSFSTELQSMIKTYEALLLLGRRELELSAGECGLILDATNGTMLGDILSIQMLPASIEDAIRYDKLDAKWAVDGEELVNKLKGASVLALAALADAIKRWWDGNYHKDKPDYGDMLNDPPGMERTIILVNKKEE